jgi:hypothetical protein
MAPRSWYGRSFVVLPVQVFEHITVDDRIEIGMAEDFKHLMEMREVLLPQQAGRIEILARQLAQGRHGLAGRRNRTAIVSPYCNEADARDRANLRFSSVLP